MSYSLPSCLYHYTSLEALLSILGGESMKNGNMVFRFCDPLQANDKREINFFEDYVYKKGKSGEKLKESVDKMGISDEKPFILCLIRHYEGNKEKNFGVRYYPHCEIPMWDMYANKFKGVRIKFKAKQLKDYFNTEQIKRTYVDAPIKLAHCEYMTVKEITNKGKELRKSIGENTNKQDIKELYQSSALYKTKSWVYEDEWRAILWIKDDNKIKIDPTRGKLYVELEIPLRCVSAITIGPLANQMDVEYILNTIKKKYSVNMKDINIESSELFIR